MRRTRRCLAWAACGCALLGMAAMACGPFFPNNLLDRGDEAVLTAPEARFHDELARMRLVPSRFRAIPTQVPPRATLDAELADLKAVLDASNTPTVRRERILRQHRDERRKVTLFEQVTNPTNTFHSHSFDEYRLQMDPTNAPRVTGSPPQAVPGLPAEFADYLNAATAWHQGDLGRARQEWTALLRRPPAERRYKSVWAAFMLGKSWEEEKPARACEYFQTTRQLAREGFVDSLGLAAAGLGWEARCYYRAGQLTPAIDLYLEQADAGDPTATVSLRFAAARALQKQYRQLASLAKHPRARRVITAYLISGGFRDGPIDVDGVVKDSMLAWWEQASTKAAWIPAPGAARHHFADPARLWLDALEKADVRDVEAAEQIALAAYQMGQMDAAQRWLNRSRTTPLARWLQAKLHLRAGKVEAAAALLATLCREFPPGEAAAPPSTPAPLLSSLYISKGFMNDLSVAEELQGEWAVFRVARRQFTESLDLLLRSSYWLDAAYVAERVLTLDELKAYVDRSWPPTAASQSQPQKPAKIGEVADVGEALRYLLARRLARAERYAEARPYYPAQWREPFELMASHLQTARTAARPPEERARAFFQAALLARHKGLELLGTEVEPDWRSREGNYTATLTLATRESLQATNRLATDPEEVRRAREHIPQPDRRFHYRFIAASFAWEAARLLPNNQDETARVLCQAGTWLKYRDPQAADVFYKALVRRCRKTVLGAEADRRRWFPPIDVEGRLLPKPTPEPPSETSPPVEASPGNDAEGGEPR